MNLPLLLATILQLVALGCAAYLMLRDRMRVGWLLIALASLTMGLTRFMALFNLDQSETHQLFDILLIASSILLTVGLISILRFFARVNRLEAQSKLSTQELQSLISLSDDAIITKTLDGTILSWNFGAEKLFGYTAKEMIGGSIFTIVPEHRRAQEMWICEQIARGDRIEHIETERLTKDGQIRTISLSTSPVKDKAGNIFAACKIGRDITDRKKAEEQLQRSATELAASNKELEQFAGVASHDLRTPLNSIVGHLTLLEKRTSSKLSAQEQESISAAKSAAMRMGELLNHLLEFSKLTAPSNMPVKPVNFEKALHEALANLHALIDSRKPKITYAHLPTIDGYRVHMVRVFQNLIGNAIKYCTAEEPRIHVGCEEKEDEFVISVSDNGIGFDMKYAKRIFEIFERANVDQSFPGSGLGLAVCQRIIERQGGRIWAESVPGEGSTFYFSVPKPRRIPLAEAV